MPTPLYDPAALEAIRAARVLLYLAQRERHRLYLLFGPPGAQRPKEIADIAAARLQLDQARAAARLP